MKKTPKWYYAVLIFIPLFIVLSIELFLRTIDYGKDLSQWYEITEEKLILNPNIGARYFSNVKNFPHSNHDSFDKKKKPGSFRIFVFGGSTTAGFPYQPNGSFSRYLNDALKLQYPKIHLEVINLGITAVNSYTILDLLPDVIEQNPDLIIIYAGHNEFYGALGVGSTESVGNSRSLIKLFLFMNKFKITQLIKNTINAAVSLFKDSSSDYSGGTLMSRMAAEKSIKLNSNLYKQSVNQYKNNLDEILNKLNNKNIPVIIGTLVSNLRDQKPFFSFDDDSISANKFYNDGVTQLKNSNFSDADSLFSLARDLDGLRFRAPSEFNKIIKTLSSKYQLYFVDIAEKFNEVSPYNIVGNNLMVDHLHPTLEGQQLIGKLFFNKIIENKIVAAGKNINNIDSLVKTNFAFSKLDSISSELRILNLLNDFPFVEKKIINIFESIELISFIDSLAYKIVKENLNWEKAHQQAYQYYLQQNQIENFIDELKVLTSQYPYKLIYYNFAAQELIKRKMYDEAFIFLFERYKIKPDDFSTKWLGNISLSQNKIPEAIKYLNESISLNNKDPQVFYNFAITNLKAGNLDTAILSVQNCLELKPDYPNARQMLLQLTK